jgi:hypothetical protein
MVRDGTSRYARRRLRIAVYGSLFILVFAAIMLYCYRPDDDDEIAEQIIGWSGQIQRESRLPEMIWGDIPIVTRGAIWKVSYRKGPVTEEMLACLTRLRGLKSLSLTGRRPIVKESLHHLSSLKHLRDLYLSNTDIRDEDLRFVAPLAALETLYLNDTAVSDVGLVHLENMQHLHLIEVSDTSITDQGAAVLAKCLPNTSIMRDGKRIMP